MDLESNDDDMDLYINGYFDTSDNKLTQDMFCTDILASGNCNNIVKSYDASIRITFSYITFIIPVLLPIILPRFTMLWIELANRSDILFLEDFLFIS